MTIDSSGSGDELDVEQPSTSTQTKPITIQQSKPKPRTVSDFFKEPYLKGSLTHKKLTQAVGKYIAKEGQPAYMVDRPGFRELLKEFDPR